MTTDGTFLQKKIFSTRYNKTNTRTTLYLISDKTSLMSFHIKLIISFHNTVRLQVNTNYLLQILKSSLFFYFCMKLN